MKRYIIALLFIFIISQVSYSQGPEIASTVKTVVAVDKIEGALHNLIDHATDNADYILARASIEALAAIDAWKNANSELIDEAFGELNKSTQDLFNKANSLVANVDQVTSKQIAELNKVSININQAAESTIISGRRSYVLSQKPIVVPPETKGMVTIRLRGVNLDKAKPELFIKGNKLESRLLGPTQVEFDVPVDSLINMQSKLTINKLVLKHRTRDGSNLLVFPKHKHVERTITLVTLPSLVGQYSIEINETKSKKETERFREDGGKFKGQNREVKKVIKPRAGWKWDLSKPREEFKVVSTGGGEAARCQDVVWNGSNEHGITIKARCDEIKQIDGLNVKWGPGYKHCGLEGPVYRIVEYEQKSSKNGSLSWLKDIAIPLPEKLHSFRLRVTSFDGRERVFTGDDLDKFYSIKKSNAYVIITPKAPSDIL